MTKIKYVFLWLLFCGTLIGGASAAETVLYDFNTPIPSDKIEQRGVTTRLTDEGALEVCFRGNSMEWPGITLYPPHGKWDISNHSSIGLNIRNTGTRTVQVGMRVDNPGANGGENCLQQTIEIIPGGMQRMEFSYQRSGEMTVELFGMRGYPAEINGRMGNQIDSRNIVAVLVFMHAPKEDCRIEIDQLSCRGSSAGSLAKSITPEEFFPLIDRFGQFRHREWPNKIHSEQELIQSRKEEELRLERSPAPKSWNQWGGWAAGPVRKSTGFFRTEKIDGQWWLVDPSGCLFLSIGIVGVGDRGTNTIISEREKWFEWLPGKEEPQYQFGYGTNDSCVKSYYYADRHSDTFDFGNVNRYRKYGPSWKALHGQLVHRRLRAWGVNTIGNWSDPAICLLRRTPYFATLATAGPVIEGSEGYWGKFVDMFHPDFATNFEQTLLREKGTSINDPWCIGYFVDNEQGWGDEVSLAIAILLSPETQPAKRIFIAELQKKYSSIQELNRQWHSEYASWEGMAADRRGVADWTWAQEDLKQFYRQCAEMYFSQIRDLLRKHAPNQLYAGCRFAWVNDTVADVAGEYCDIVSYNLYRYNVADFRYPGKVDKPVIIGEFHFGALDRGLFHTGLVATPNQQARAEAYRTYVNSMLQNPGLVGCHWFQYQDEATTGRPLDGENYQIGFVDIADTPYPELTGASRDVGEQMYRYRRQHIPKK